MANIRIAKYKIFWKKTRLIYFGQIRMLIFFSLNDDQRKKCEENQKRKKISFDPDYLHWDEEGNPISCFGEFCDEMSFNEGAFGTDW